MRRRVAELTVSSRGVADKWTKIKLHLNQCSLVIGPNFGAAKGQLLSNLFTNEMRLSSMTNGIMMLLYYERGQNVKKMLNIPKLRGSTHSKEVFRYEIEKGGIKMGEKYEE